MYHIIIQVTWLSGQLLSQTIFTCLLVHRPANILDPLLRTFVYNYLDCVNKTRKIILDAGIFFVR